VITLGFLWRRRCLKDTSVRVPLVKMSLGHRGEGTMVKMVIMGIARMMMRIVRMLVLWG